MKRLTVEQVKQLHNELLLQTGGLAGIRDENLLASAVEGPFQTFDGLYVYPTLQAKAARLGFSIVKNHPFADGNKRVGILAMLIFLEINSHEVNADDDELIALGLGLADGTISDKALMKWIFDHS